MIHDSTWLGKVRAGRGARVAITLGATLACLLLASFAPAADASPYDMRGEWSIEYKSKGQPALAETGVIASMNEATGAFSGTFHAAIGLSTALEGTVSGTTVKLSSTTNSPFGVVEFVAESAVLDTVKNTLAGSGAYYLNGTYNEPGEVTATRLKTYKEVQEQEEREQREREEVEARSNVRGEWALTLEAGPEKLEGVALIAEKANAKNEFASKSALFENSFGGSFSGTLEGEQAKVTVTTDEDAALSLPPGSFTSETIAVSSKTNPTSMSGSGKFMVGPTELTGTLKATRIRSYQQIEAQETKEREAKEKLEEETKAKEKAEREATEKHERELREAAEKAAKAVLPIKTPLPVVAPKAVPVALSTTSSTVSKVGGLSLKLTNPNGAPASGRLKLTFTSTAAGAKHTKGHAKSKTTKLGEAAFSIAADGSEVVKLTLTGAGRAELAHIKTMHAVVTVTTQVSGQPAVSKTYSLTLRSGSAKHRG